MENSSFLSFFNLGLVLLADWQIILNYFYLLNSSSAFSQQEDRPTYFTVFYLRFA